MASSWRYEQTDGAPALVRDCDEIVAVSVDDKPTEDLASALTPLGHHFGLAMYSETATAALLGRTLEILAGSTDLAFSRTNREVARSTRTATVSGAMLIANGRRESLFFGGLGRIHHDFRRFQEIGQDPPQLGRLLELEAAGIDAVELPSSPPVDNRFAGLNFAQPVVISVQRLREAEESKRVVVEWSP